MVEMVVFSANGTQGVGMLGNGWTKNGAEWGEMGIGNIVTYFSAGRVRDFWALSPMKPHKAKLDDK